MCVKLSMDSGLNSSLASTADSGRATPVISASLKYDEVHVCPISLLYMKAYITFALFMHIS